MGKRSHKRRVGEYVLAGVLALVIVWLLFLIVNIFRKEEIARKAATQTRAEVAALEEREGVLRENIAELDTERGQEATLRETFGVARPGEEVIIVVPPKEELPPPPLPWWQRALDWAAFWN